MTEEAEFEAELEDILPERAEFCSYFFERFNLRLILKYEQSSLIESVRTP
jgi:hypothetical protein